MLLCNVDLAGSENTFPFLELLRAPLLELVRQQDVVAKELRVTNTYLRSGANSQYKYTSSQATQHRDPNFKSALIEVRSWQCMPPYMQPKAVTPIHTGMSNFVVCRVYLTWLCIYSCGQIGKL